MKMVTVVVCFFIVSSAFAQKISMGTSGKNRSEAARELVSVCESSPLVEAGRWKVAGVDNLRFTEQDDKSIFAWGDCLYEGESAPSAQSNSIPSRASDDFMDESISESSGPHVIIE